jgi:hypothetical protein
VSERLRPAGHSIHGVLKPAGFKRRGNAWRRDVGGFVDLVNLQLSKSLDRLWVNLGVIEPDSFRRCWEAPVGATYDEASCTVRSRLGVLIDGLDRSWPAGDPDSAAAIADRLESVGLAWLDGMHALAAIQVQLEHEFAAELGRGYPPVAIALAVIQAKNGQADAACATLRQRRGWPLGLWEDRLDSVARDLGCSHHSTAE